MASCQENLVLLENLKMIKDLDHLLFHPKLNNLVMQISLVLNDREVLALRVLASLFKTSQSYKNTKSRS
jgi:hypothetical protein